MVTAEKPTQLESQWMKPRQWKELTGMPNSTTLALIREGRLRAVWIGKRLYIPASEATDFFSREGRPAA